jgi:hypothetical protein
MTQILITDEKELKLNLHVLSNLYKESDENTKVYLNSLCGEVHENISELFAVYGIDKYAWEVLSKQKEMNETYMEFTRQGGHVIQDYTFLHSFIRKY